MKIKNLMSVCEDIMIDIKRNEIRDKNFLKFNSKKFDTYFSPIQMIIDGISSKI